METKWTQFKGRPNKVKKFKWGYLAYNPNTGVSEIGKMFTEMANVVGSLIGEPKKEDGEETAIYSYKHNKFYILKGDFTKQLDKCKTLGDCLKVYNANIDKRSNWSTD